MVEESKEEAEEDEEGSVHGTDMEGSDSEEE
jgi:hypothetical protein